MAITPTPVLTRPTAPRLRSLPQTYGAIGLALGSWVGLLLWRGLRPVVWLGGSIATIVMLGWWVLEVRRLPLPKASEDLLDATGLDQQLVALESLAGQSATAKRLWTAVVQDMQSLRLAAADIAQRDSSLVPDLYEAIVVDRSFCSPNQWQLTTAAYRDRYQAHQQKQIEIKRVILVGDLGEESLPQLPTPEDFAALPTFGRSNTNALARWRQGKSLPPELQGARIEFLSCGSTPNSTP